MVANWRWRWCSTPEIGWTHHLFDDNATHALRFTAKCGVRCGALNGARRGAASLSGVPAREATGAVEEGQWPTTLLRERLLLPKLRLHDLPRDGGAERERGLMNAYEAIESSDLALRVSMGVGPTGIVEGALHEMAHAAVFGISFRHPTLIEAVRTRFHRYVRRRASDRSECAALAVEAVAARRLGLGIQFSREVVPFAIRENMRVLDAPEVRAMVSEYMRRPITRRRAERIVRHVQAAARRGSLNEGEDRDG